MNTSPKSPSPRRNAKLEAQRTALTRLFWANRVMHQFRTTRCQLFRIEMRHTATAEEFARLVFDDLPLAVPANDEVIFATVPLAIGDEMWAAITASVNSAPALRIIEPFLVPDRDLSLVPFFREEC